MLLRIQSPEGTRRLEINSNDSTSSLFEKVHDEFELEGYTFCLFKKRNKTEEILSSRSRTLEQYGLHHGDMIYLSVPNGSLSHAIEQSNEPTVNLPTVPVCKKVDGTKIPYRSTVEEDDVDTAIKKLDGKIQRKPDPKFCRHGENSFCVHCLPLEPYDESYLREQNIKHMSFHSYLRKLSSGLDKGKFAHLENINCCIKPGCTGHPPWPKAVCSKCQPKAITLNRQLYRHVDNVVFENPHLVERFLHYWRITGCQRIGFLYGRYEVHLDVPLGIKGVVAAIYEPPQESTRDFVHLLNDPREETVEKIATKLGLRRIGWIFTDLVAEDAQKGTVRHFRHAQSHFLSAQECIMAGHFQNLHPNPCRYSSDGYFGSKFVTVCVTGDAQHQVHMEGYQTSNQCMALVRDKCLVPTLDAPELGYVRESSSEQYVPDVYYKEKDTYGNEVTRIGRPLPVEYLLVDVPVSTPLEPLFTFYVGKQQAFPVENRPIDGHLQDVSALTSYLKQFSRNEFLFAASDFHFLIYIATMEMYPLLEFMDPLLEAVRQKDSVAANTWSCRDQWSTVEQLLDHAEHNSLMGDSLGDETANGRRWTCAHCTFINQPHLTSCEICNLPHQLN